ncbi:hypothetical protein DD238_006028 [Peronospora effusa]|uniref:Uncharacterized protein n=1 Tax=Peronospora effusa TaxID=542832 RepID=A0A3M6VC57_9STRA|nr:hypothetical protein DD238_006028 [Peronospora effusa]RQM13455.1 hypothetical protein DD237_006434 [Peronospora effusa]
MNDREATPDAVAIASADLPERTILRRKLEGGLIEEIAKALAEKCKKVTAKACTIAFEEITNIKSIIAEQVEDLQTCLKR